MARVTKTIRDARERAAKTLLLLGERASKESGFCAEAIYRLAAEVMLYGFGAWPKAASALGGTP